MRIAIIFGIVFIGLFFYGGYMHEVVHQTIYQRFGVESEISLFNKDMSFKITAKNISLSNEDYMEMNKLQLQTEIVGYHLCSFFLLIGIGLFLIILFIEDVWRMKNENK